MSCIQDNYDSININLPNSRCGPDFGAGTVPRKLLRKSTNYINFHDVDQTQCLWFLVLVLHGGFFLFTQEVKNFRIPGLKKPLDFIQNDKHNATLN